MRGTSAIVSPVAGSSDRERLAGVGVDPDAVDVRLCPEQIGLDGRHRPDDIDPLATSIGTDASSIRHMKPQFVHFDDVRAFTLVEGVSRADRSSATAACST